MVVCVVQPLLLSAFSLTGDWSLGSLVGVGRG